LQAVVVVDIFEVYLNKDGETALNAF
jgi:hypothetical protein